MKIPISKPYLDNIDRQNLIKTFDSSWISSNGKNILEFEKKFSKYTKSKYSLTCSNGTIAIELALKALGVKKNSEVILPNLTFAATINAVINVGAKPIIIDISGEDFGYDTNLLKKNINKNTFAIIFVHFFGIPIDIKKQLKDIPFKNFKIIEDCAESLGAKYKTLHLGNFSDCSTFSFFSNKIITTGEGGMINFKHKKIFENAKKIKNQGRTFGKFYWHDEVGGNYRMTNLQASLGLSQLKKIDKLLKKRKKIYNDYDLQFKDFPKVLPLHKLIKTNFNKISYWYYTISIFELNERHRDNLIKYLKSKNIETRPLFYPLSSMKIYKKYLIGSDYNSKKLSYVSLSLPTYPDLSMQEIRYISKNVINFLNNL